MAADSPWLVIDAWGDYLTGGQRTETGRQKFSRRFLRKEVKAGRLRAAQIGGRGQLISRRDWLDAWALDRATPVTVSVRRRA